MPQWATLRHDRDGNKSTVSVRADPEARSHLLHSSGLGAVVFAREHAVSREGLEYTPIWVYQQAGANTNPLGTRACEAAYKNWGLCKSAKNVGVRRTRHP